jgi:UDP-N-acetylmuramoyl-L-alanyl-D-glutamate--2,6-diaminopimelate ligase
LARSRVGGYDALLVAGFESPLDPPLSEDGAALELFSAAPLSEVPFSEEDLSEEPLSADDLSDDDLSDDDLSDDDLSDDDLSEEEDAAGRLSLR